MTEEDDDAAVKAKSGHYEVNPEKMKAVRKSLVRDMTDEDVKNVIDMRNEYMHWMHANFAKKVVKPPPKAEQKE